jgi:transcriptional regulator with XRE-family HTH domain
MAQFYKELKDLRESREISLEEISERTKINISYLNAIESGDFGEIETPYLRLFLRAYAEEIGGDSQRSLEQLDSFLGTTRPRIISNPLSEEEIHNEVDNEYGHISVLSGKIIRQDYLIGGILSLILLFAIAVFQKIFNEDSEAIITEEGPLIQNMTQPILKSDLQKDYILDQTIDELLQVKPPFFLKIKTLEQTAYTFIKDTLPPISKSIKPNQEVDLDAFIGRSELILTKTRGVSIFLNATEIDKVAEYDYPIRLFINTRPPSMKIQRFKPLSLIK